MSARNQFSEADLESYKGSFDAYDKNSDGHISRSELGIKLYISKLGGGSNPKNKK